MHRIKVEFPKEAGMLPRRSMFARYYNTYYQYVLNLFKYADAQVVYTEDTAVADGAFIMTINGKMVIIDYSDHLRDGSFVFDNCEIPKMNVPIFKFHYSYGIHDSKPNYFPFSPVSFYDWDQYYTLESEIVCNPSDLSIINRQIPYGNALKRRQYVRNILVESFRDKVRIGKIPQIYFWREVNDALVAVFVPGCRPNMLDRGHLQYLAFGCCTISPKIITMLPWNTLLEPDRDYIACKDDYSDLIDKIKWLGDNPSYCKKIGRNAKGQFLGNCTPSSIINWVFEVLEKFYG